MVAITRKQRDLVFKAIADPTRREILELLSGGELAVGELADNFGCSRPAISKHVRLLREAGLLTTQPRGASTICSLNGKPLAAVHEWLQTYQAFWNQNLRSLKRYVEDNS